MAVQAPAVDMDKLMTFLGQVIGELGATVNAGLIVVGDRLGLYKAMASSGPLTPAQLAEKTGTNERYVREWLNNQAAGGYTEYDPASGKLIGSDRSSFTRNQDFAAVVQWEGLPGDLTVDARWYDTFGNVVGRVGPSTPSKLGAQSVVPVIVPQGLHHNLPGHYTFVVERLQNGVPVEVLARRIVLVER